MISDLVVDVYGFAHDTGLCLLKTVDAAFLKRVHHCYLWGFLPNL